MNIDQNIGSAILKWSDQLANYSEPAFAAIGQLTVTYLTEAHQQAADFLRNLMSDSGFDEINIDALGNVVGIYHAKEVDAKRLMTGSHYDTVRNAGKYDGRLGVLLPIAIVKELAQTRKRLPFGIEVVAFAEEEGQRYRATFLGSGALVGKFNPEWLDQKDSDGVSMRDAMLTAGLPGTLESINAIARAPSDYIGFVEVHIEQGPVLNAANLPLGIVTSINAAMRGICTVTGSAAHAGTTPMDMRKDALLAAAQIALIAEAQALADPGAVATVGQMQVPSGSINVIPGSCVFSLDMRAPSDDQRDSLALAVLSRAREVAKQRSVGFEFIETMRVSAAPSDPGLQKTWERAVERMGQPVFKLNSGAGHDAMMLHQVMPQAMLFMRGGNDGISHNPLESISSGDAQLAAETFMAFIDELASQY